MSQGKPFGLGAGGAFWRQGLAELRAVFYPDSNVAQPVEYGMWGTPTPGEVAADRHADVNAFFANQEPIVDLVAVDPRTPPESKLAAKQAEVKSQLPPSRDDTREPPREPER